MITSELSGYALNYAVAMCEQRRDDPDRLLPLEWHLADFCNDWAQGGEIIERENIELVPKLEHWDAYYAELIVPYEGKTALIAAMRCYVASVLGDEVNIPDEIIEAEQWS